MNRTWMGKSEYRNPKSETNSNHQNPNVPEPTRLVSTMASVPGLLQSQRLCFPMRVLFAIPHYVSRAGDATTHARKHGSVEGGTERRARALAECLTALQQSFRPTHWIIDHARSIAWDAPSVVP